MKMQECVLPVRCVKCGTTFDLWYDLLANDKGSEVAAEIALESAKDEQHLCWDCRKEMSALPRFEAEMEMGVLEENDDDFKLSWE